MPHRLIVLSFPLILLVAPASATSSISISSRTSGHPVVHGSGREASETRPVAGDQMPEVIRPTGVPAALHHAI